MKYFLKPLLYLLLFTSFLGRSLSAMPLPKGYLYSTLMPLVVSLKVDKVLSKGLVGAIENKDVFLKVVGYAKREEYKDVVGVFEKAVMSEGSALKALINEKPEVVDVFFMYAKQKPSATADEVIELVKVVSGAGILSKYTKIRGFLGDGKIKAYLNNQQLLDFENLLKTANDDVLKAMDEFKSADEFAEMIRGYKDNPTAFTNAIKNVESFNGSRGWLNFWKLTPKMENSLNELDQLRLANKIDDVGNATDIQLASIHTYTANGDFINVPYRYQPTWFGEYNIRAVKHINEGLNELRKLPQRVVTTEVYSGKAFSKADFESKFVGKINTEHPYNGYMSTSKLESVAEGFTIETKKWAGSGEKIAVIQRVTPKNGVYIDDISDWGKNLGPSRHSTSNVKIQIQEEVMLNSQKLKQVSEPIPVMENGVHKTIDGMKVYYVDFIEIL